MTTLQPIPIHQILPQIWALSVEDQDLLMQIVTQRLRESKRQRLRERIAQAEENYQIGKVTQGTVANLMEQLNHD